MLDERAPSANVAGPRPEAIIDADVLSEHVAAPAVMVARDEHHLDARFAHIRERREHPEPAARDHRLPFVPEIEQITVDEQRARLSRQMSEKCDQRPFDARWRDAEMDVGNDVAWGSEHSDSLALAQRLYKHRGSTQFPLGMLP